MLRDPWSPMETPARPVSLLSARCVPELCRQPRRGTSGHGGAGRGESRPHHVHSGPGCLLTTRLHSQPSFPQAAGRGGGKAPRPCVVTWGSLTAGWTPRAPAPPCVLPLGGERKLRGWSGSCISNERWCTACRAALVGAQRPRPEDQSSHLPSLAKSEGPQVLKQPSGCLRGGE